MKQRITPLTFGKEHKIIRSPEEGGLYALLAIALPFS